ncbi:hypothetical protein D0Y65_035632 [Glycine soja]|uniref:Uncharacterized protein n=1 Tax=Glycine soja TaxID=3848 RepID=A0A445HB04_GLYSO|nr:hypothetical protein D0Y65_035632 [Glycine soja]
MPPPPHLHIPPPLPFSFPPVEPLKTLTPKKHKPPTAWTSRCSTTRGVLWECAQTSAWELGERGVRYGSGLVKRAKERVDNVHVWRVVELVSKLRVSPNSVGVLILSQWSRLGLERVELRMGKPLHVGPICCDRYCLFLPVTGERPSVKVMVAVPTITIDNFHRFLRESNL